MGALRALSGLLAARRVPQGRADLVDWSTTQEAAQGQATAKGEHVRQINIDTARITFVPGHPRPKGSYDGQAVRDGAGELTGRVRLVDPAHSKRWQRLITKHVEGLAWAPIVEAPCEVDLTFWFAPASLGVNRKYLESHPFPTHPHVGDLDKLVRGVLDALQAADVYGNDRQVARIVCDKVWAVREHGQQPGVGIRVAEL